MKYKTHYLLILLTIITISFPSICFSELKTGQGEYCEVYLGDMKNKKESEEFRKTVRNKSIENGLHKYTDPENYPSRCFTNIISNYLEKVVVVSHTEQGRKICDTVRITLDPEVINKSLIQNICKFTNGLDLLERLYNEEWYEIDDVLIKKTEKINIGLHGCPVKVS
jgi:hypothetical protein